MITPFKKFAKRDFHNSWNHNQIVLEKFKRCVIYCVQIVAVSKLLYL